MRLLITTDTVGGVWTYTAELSEGLLMRGHDVLLISMGREPSRDQQNWAQAMRARWWRRFRYVATAFALEWMRCNEQCYSAAEPLLMRHIRTWRPDVLHLNQFCYGALPTNIPKVVIAHSDVLSWSQACRGKMPVDSHWFRHYMKVVSRGLAQADAVVAPTRWMLTELCNYYYVPAQRAVIANGRTAPISGVRRARRIQAVTIGRLWDEGKNVRLLEDVDSPMPLLVGGELSLDAEPPFTSARLRLLGQLSAEAVLNLFAESSIYIATSRYEPFGLAPVEAALSGCAIVAHDVASLREVWGESAFYFSDAGDLTLLLHALHADRALMSRSANKARARAQSLYLRDPMIEQYLDLYARLGAPVPSSDSSGVPAQHVL
jgi:glycosyltransferase involved in cell wall biosynthesis